MLPTRDSGCKGTNYILERKTKTEDFYPPSSFFLDISTFSLYFDFIDAFIR